MSIEAAIGNDVLTAAVADLPTIGLDELDRVAALQVRTDRKYILEPDVAEALFATLDHTNAVLTIDGRRSFGYRTVYFDTPDDESYLGAALRRRHRYKVRIRTYVDSGLTMLEVKRRDARGVTVKERLEQPEGPPFTAEGAAFIEDKIGQPGLAARLQPVLVTEFDRITLLDTRESSRTTVDQHLTWFHGEDWSLRFAPRVVAETKTAGTAGTVDRWLWAQGHRYRSFSKFCVGRALAEPDLPANKWNRILRTIGGWEPDHEARRARMQAVHNPPRVAPPAAS